MRHLLLAVSLILSPCLYAEKLRLVKPKSVGFSAERLLYVNRFAQNNIESGKHAGMVTMIARHGEIAHFEAHGTQGIDDDRPMKKDSLFRIFSMTKPVTAVAAMMLYEEGAFQLNDSISKYLPEFAGISVHGADTSESHPATVTVEQLLTHTAGLSYGWHPADPVDTMYRDAKIWESRDLDDFIERLSKIPLRYEPGTRYHYSVSFDVVGALIERWSGMTLEEFFAQRIFGPLGMEDTFFNVPKAKLDRLASNHTWNAEKEEIQTLPPSANPPAVNVTLFSGGGGLISSAMDYMKFCEMLRRGGSFNGARLLGPKTIQHMTTNHLPPSTRNFGATEHPDSHLYPGQDFGLGFGVITQPGFSQVISSAGEYSWGGAADTKFWIDPEEDLVAIVMTQLMNSPWPTRYQMKVATYQALTTLGKR